MSQESKVAGLSSAKLIGFIPTLDPIKAKLFYEATLGLKFVEDDGFALVFDANGIKIRISKVENYSAPPFTILGWHVDNIVDTMNMLIEKGVSFERYSFLEQDELGYWCSPNNARVAWFKDPDGNVLSLTEFGA